MYERHAFIGPVTTIASHGGRLSKLVVLKLCLRSPRRTSLLGTIAVALLSALAQLVMHARANGASGTGSSALGAAERVKREPCTPLPLWMTRFTSPRDLTHVKACIRLLGFLFLTTLTSACLDRKLTPLNPCLVSTVSRKVTVSSIDRVDLLFMVDDSASMTSKQESLKAQFPRMIQVLSTGMRRANDPNPFPPVADMHLAVVSSDLGVVGQPDIMGCDPNGGDDGRLQHTSSGDPGCQATYPDFLSYNASRDNPMQIGVDFGCIASLGAMGCTFENQLEAPLKALWPRVVQDKDGNVLTQNPYTFLAPPGGVATGRGDTAPPEGSLGFLRTDPNAPSVLGIILLTDEDDQSSQNTAYLSTTDPSANQSTQVRPAMNAQNLYPVQRYIDGFKALRPSQPELVVFAAIAGVPTDLVSPQARANVDFSNEMQREAYYDRIAGDRRMQPQVMNGFGMASFAPACQRTNAMRQAETATPARRILEVVRGFGENGTLQSICADDYGPGMDAIIDIIAKQLGAVCLPRPLIRRSDGTVPCDVVWELPKPGTEVPGTPAQCNAMPFLKPVATGRAQFNGTGGVNCEVDQLPVMPGDRLATGDGWYYDTFSPGVMGACPRNRQQRVTFTDRAKPGNGITIRLECLNEVQSAPSLRRDVVTTSEQPEIGSACTSTSTPAAPTPGTGNPRSRTTPAAPRANTPCAVQLRGGGVDNSMFCHAELNVCVQGCETSDDCPAAWVCDKRPETTAMTNGKAYCANPTCGGD